jgi:hypothetical protein
VHRTRRAIIVLALLFLSWTVASGQAASYSEYSFYQPREYSQGAYYWSAYLRVWSSGRFDLWLRTEQTYPGAASQCDQVRLYISHGKRYTASGGRITFPGTAVYDVTDNCLPRTTCTDRPLTR